MKLCLSALASLTLLLGACSSSNKTTNTTTGEKQKLAGYWTLDRVTTTGAGGQVRVTAFDDASSTCFEGSRWMLMPNGKGSYNISSNASGCSQGERQIYWSVSRDEASVFQLKRLADGDKARKVETGYRMNIETSTDSEFTLSTPVSLEGRSVTVRYHFTKEAGQ